MAIYKLNAKKTLEGSPAEIVDTLLNHNRKHLYGKQRFDILVPEENKILTYYKSKTNYCPDCGTVHGLRIQLISSIQPSFCENFNPKKCPACRVGIPEEKPWMKEWVGDDHEKVASS